VVSRFRQNPARSVVESGIIRLFPSIRFGRFRQYPIVGFDENRSDLFRHNPVRNPAAKILTKSRSDSTVFSRKNTGFRYNPISDCIVSYGIRRLDWITWVKKVSSEMENVFFSRNLAPFLNWFKSVVTPFEFYALLKILFTVNFFESLLLRKCLIF
jgi:hypothetical protein